MATNSEIARQGLVDAILMQYAAYVRNARIYQEAKERHDAYQMLKYAEIIETIIIMTMSNWTLDEVDRFRTSQDEKRSVLKQLRR